jgi:hypothetical protein
MPTGRYSDTAAAMIEDSAAKGYAKEITREFRPDGHGFLLAQGAAALLGIAGGLAALSGSPPTDLWIGLAVVSLTAALALRSVRLVVTSDSVILRLPGLARTFPVDQIDPIRCNELAFMDLFQISLHNGRFMLIPRKAFSDVAPFAAMEALISKSAPVRPEQNDIDAVVADRSGPSGPRRETP